MPSFYARHRGHGRVVLGEGAWTPCRTWAAGPSRGAVSPCRPNPPNGKGSSNGESWWATGTSDERHQTTSWTTGRGDEAPAGQAPSCWLVASGEPTAKCRAGQGCEPQRRISAVLSRLSRDKRRALAWGHPLWRSSKVRGEEGTAHVDPAQGQTLTGWPGAGSTSRQLLFSHRQPWGSLTLATIHSTACILPSRPWVQDQTQEAPGNQ